MNQEQRERSLGQYAPKTKYHLNQVVFINTGGETSRGIIDDQVYSHQDANEKLIYKTVPKGYYWKEQDAYRIRFENGTTQYIPSKYISDTEVNEYTLCIRCQMGFLPHQLTGAGLCQECNEKHSREAFDEEHALCERCNYVVDVEVLDENAICPHCAEIIKTNSVDVGAVISDLEEILEALDDDQLSLSYVRDKIVKAIEYYKK
jgi:hypothetical protein